MAMGLSRAECALSIPLLKPDSWEPILLEIFDLEWLLL